MLGQSRTKDQKTKMQRKGEEHTGSEESLLPQPHQQVFLGMPSEAEPYTYFQSLPENLNEQQAKCYSIINIFELLHSAVHLYTLL